MDAEAVEGPANEETAAMNDAVTLAVVRGEPTAEEVAALVAVLAGRAAAQEQGQGRSKKPAPVAGWTDRSRYVQGRIPHSPDGWRKAALPR